MDSPHVLHASDADVVGVMDGYKGVPTPYAHVRGDVNDVRPRGLMNEGAEASFRDVPTTHSAAGHVSGNAL